MKNRLLVMNGQCILQTEQDGAWTNQTVEKAAIKPGIYNLYAAKEADKSQRHDGLIVHTDSATVYQQVGKQIIAHARNDFDIVPKTGSERSIVYDAAGSATLSTEVRLTRSRSR